MGQSDTEAIFPGDVIYPCKDGTILYTKPGNRAKGDKKIFIKFPRNPWMPSLECLAAWIWMKAFLVEDNNYKRSEGYQGKEYLRRFIEAVFANEEKIRAICRRFKIPGF